MALAPAVVPGSEIQIRGGCGGSSCEAKVWLLPSGKRLHNYGKSPFYSWVNPLFLWPFSIAMLVYQRVTGKATDFNLSKIGNSSVHVD